MPNGLELHTEDRILLYLSGYGSLDDAYEVEPDVTQKEIALNVRVQRKHISRYLKKLLVDGMIEERACHVRGAKQRMKCYSLTGPGTARASDIIRHVENQKIKVSINGDIREMSVSDIDGATSVHLTLSDIVAEALDGDDILLMKNLESIEESRRRVMDEKTRKAEVYRNALAVAWRSGVLTSSEKHLIDALKEHLGVTDEEHKSMETKIINAIPQTGEVSTEVYDGVQDILDGNPTPRERQILELLKRNLETG